MNTISSGSLLQQMRLMAARAEGVANPESIGGNGAVKPGAGFGEMLATQLRDVSNLQQTSSALATRFEQGDSGIDVAQVMVAMQRSQIGFQAVTQVRNKLLTAYQEIMNMPV
jgi:flagellar hook-basal body complex protein FliE